MVINGERINIPTHWQDKRFKTRHYQRIIKEWDQDKDIADRDYFKLFNILTENRYSAFEDTLENQVKIETSVAWVVLESFRFSDHVPKFLEVNGREAEINKNIGQLSIGANIKARQTLDKSTLFVDNEGKFLNCDCYSMLIAIYLQPDLMPSELGGFRWKEAQELEKVIAEMPIYITRPIGFFLLNHVYKYGQMRGNPLLQILTNLTNKIKRMLPDLPKFKGLFRFQT